MPNWFPGPSAPDLQSRLIASIGLPGFGSESSVVVVSRVADPAQSDESGGLCTTLTHARGVSWTDTYGEKLARMAIEAGGQVAFCFTTLADAVACQHRLQADGVQ